jgi:hypothetical protein
MVAGGDTAASAERPGRGRAALAAIAPTLCCVAGALAVTRLGIDEPFYYRRQQMEEWFFVLVGAAALALPFVGVLAFRAVRRARTCGPVMLGLALLPWAVGIVGAYAWSFEAADHVLGCVENIRLIAVGTELCVALDIEALGLALGGGMLLGVAAAHRLAGPGPYALWPLALGVFALLGGSAASVIGDAMRALASAAPDQRLAVLLEGASRLAPLLLLQLVGTGGLLVVLLALGWRARRRGTRGRIGRVRTALAVLIPAIVIGASALVGARIDRIERLAAAPVWAHVEDFRPLTARSYYFDGGPPHGIVIGGRMIPWEGEPFELGALATPHGQARIAARLATLAEGLQPIDPALARLVEQEGLQVSDSWRRPSGRLALAIDDRVPTNVLRRLVDAVRAAGVRKLSLVGQDTTGRAEGDDAALLAGLPFFEHTLAPTMTAGTLLVGGATSRGCRESPHVIWYGEIGARETVTVRPWPGKDEFSDRRRPFELGSTEVARADREDLGVSSYGTVCLALGRDARPEHVLRVAVAAEELGLPVALITAPRVQLRPPEPVEPIDPHTEWLRVPPRLL